MKRLVGWMTFSLRRSSTTRLPWTRGAAEHLLLRPLGVLVVELDALGDVRRAQDLADGLGRARVDQLHHQLVVGDAEVAEAPQARAGVHEEVQEHPALGVEDLLERELRGVGLVDRVHHLLGDVREHGRSAVVLVDHAGSRLGARPDHVVVVPARDADHLRGVVVEREVHARVVGEVRGDVGRAQLDLPVLHVLGMNELDVPEDVHLPEEGGTDQPVEIAARHQPVTLCMKLGHEPCIGISARK